MGIIVNAVRITVILAIKMGQNEAQNRISDWPEARRLVEASRKEKMR